MPNLHHPSPSTMTLSPTGARSDLGRPLVIGHRGSPRTHPENSLEGLRHALDRGADGIEFDLRLAADGVPILAHDPDLSRTHKERVPVDSLPAARLPVPALADVLAGLAPHRDRVLDLELKVAVPIDTLADHLDDAGWRGPRIVTSFHTEIVRDYRDAGWTAGLLVDDRRLQPRDAAALIDMSEADFLGVRNPVFLGSLARILHDADAALWLWTLNRTAHIRRAMRKGVDAVITDYPEKVAGIVRAGDVGEVEDAADGGEEDGDDETV